MGGGRVECPAGNDSNVVQGAIKFPGALIISLAKDRCVCAGCVSNVSVDARRRCDVPVGESSPECREGGLDRLEGLGRPHEDCWLPKFCKGGQGLVSGTLMAHHNQGDNIAMAAFFIMIHDLPSIVGKKTEEERKEKHQCHID